MYEVLLGVPSSGVVHDTDVSWLASKRHKVHRTKSCNSGPNFNSCWIAGLNYGARGLCTHFAMVHADIDVVEDEEGLRWLDRLIEEMDKTAADFISVPVAIKDERGILSCGIGDPKNRWNPWRRFTTYELGHILPTTFSAADIGYGDKYLLHNHALCVWDMRKPLWYEPTSTGSNRFIFNFTEDVRLVGGMWGRAQDSEDWAYSRQLWLHEASTVMTSRVKVIHHGAMPFASWGEGTSKHDEDTAGNWRQPAPEVLEKLAEMGLAK